MENKDQTEKSEIALKEEEILKFWEENKIFEKTLEKESPNGEFVFYEGPPTSNGRPGIHHIEARSFKDIIPRYKTMSGYYVRRKAGWDTHGLPVELEVEKKLGIKSKKEIEEYGIDLFNQKCKESVWQYLDEWNLFTKRIGYWVDQENPYVTYYPEYIESVWNIVKQIADKDYLYKDYKVLPWCPRCGTALSSHELAQGYQDVKDLSIYVKFKIKSVENSYILAWTTTPWTLPGNTALAVGADLSYVEIKMKESGESYLLGKERLSLIEGEYEIVKEYKGSDIVGLEYEPLYPYLKDNLPENQKEKTKNAFKVYSADFVTVTDGTGIVHIAPMYGSDDFDLGKKNNLPKSHIINESGNYLSWMGFLAGLFVKDEATAVEIIKDLAKQNLLFKKEKYEHNYPHCWRCKTPMIYFARDSWYIKMSQLKDKMVAENKKINWEPEHIKEGRFGEWLKDIKDWAISRERYWGTPLPVWDCESCQKREVVGSIDELVKKHKKANNNYLIMRHGQAENNVLNIVSCHSFLVHPLTEKGRDQVLKSIEDLKDKKIDLIFTSPFLRTEETARIIKKNLGLSDECLIIDDRLHEIKCGDFDGRAVSEYHSFFLNSDERFTRAPEGGENYLDIKRRTGSLLLDLEEKYSGKNILIVTHDAPAWLLFSAAGGLDKKKIKEIHDHREFFLDNAEIRDLNFKPLPVNHDFELDLHKPFIDDYKITCDCGGKMNRVKEVMDVWFDSGAMPFAQDHYPFNLAQGEQILRYPADFISEAIDQTRGWFYTLHAIGTLLGKGRAYKNVICLGHILDKDGKKMSKSVGNVVNPWEMMNKYGVDALRFWMYSVNQPGESKNFDEKNIDEIVKKVFNLLTNVYKFYELYKAELVDERVIGKNILDQWILARLDSLSKEVTKYFDDFRILEPARLLRDFTADLSQWYLRRSRDRFKGADQNDKDSAINTTRFVLLELSKIMAPMTPFYAEDLYQKTKKDTGLLSVHLESWIKDIGFLKPEVLEKMEEVRKIVSVGLLIRQKSGIKVRQPLASLKLKVENTNLSDEYLEIIKDELNVKEIIVDKNISDEVELDTKITLELKEEGDYREFLRAIQDLRKQENLTINDQILLLISTDNAGKDLILKFENDLKKSTQISELRFEDNDGVEVKAGDILFKIKISI